MTGHAGENLLHMLFEAEAATVLSKIGQQIAHQGLSIGVAHQIQPQTTSNMATSAGTSRRTRRTQKAGRSIRP